MNTSEDILPLLEMLIARMERLSADSGAPCQRSARLPAALPGGIAHTTWQ